LALLLACFADASTQAAVQNPAVIPDDSLIRPQIPPDSIARNFGLWDDTETGGTTTFDKLEFRKAGFSGALYTDCYGFAFFHPQHVVRLPNKDGHAYFAATNSDGSYGFPDGRLTIYKSDGQVDPLTDRLPNLPGTDGYIVWEQSFDSSWPYPVDDDLFLGWNHPGKMQVIGNLLLISMEQWDNGWPGICWLPDGSGSPEDAVFFYDIRDPEHPVYWGSLTASELGVGSNAINDVLLIKAGNEYVLNVRNRWWTASDISPDINNWTYRGTGIATNQHGSPIYSYEDYGRPPALPSYGATVPRRPGELRAMYFDGDDDTNPNYVTGLEYLEVSSICFEDPGYTVSPCEFERSATNLTRIAKRDKIYRSAPNPYLDRKDYDANSTYVTGGVPIIYVPLVSFEAISTTDDVIYQIHNPANVRKTLGQALNDTTLTWTTGGDGGWFAQLYESRDGDSAAKASRIDAGKSTWLETTINGYGDLTFWWKVETERQENILSFTLDGQPVAGGTIWGSQGWAQMTVNIPTNGTHTLRWTYQNNAGNTTNFIEGVWVDQVAWNIPIPVAVDQPRFWWKGLYNFIGTAEHWFGQSTVTHDGLHAAQSGDIGSYDSNWLGAVFTGPGTVSFWWKVYSEANYDFLRVEVDGAQQASAPQISGDVDWQQRKVWIPAGSHPVSWIYELDVLGEPAGDAGWLDQVVFTSSIVSNTNDSGPGSLRDTIAGSMTGATITFDPGLDGQTISLASTLNIDNSITIDASGLANGLTLSGNGGSNVLYVPASRTVSLNGLAIVDGSNSSYFQGNGLYNAGTTTINNSTFSGNTGAIENTSSGILTLINTTLSGNDAVGPNGDGGSGGGLINLGTATLIHTTITNNSAQIDGGGIWNSGTLHLENSIVAGNTTPGSGPDLYLWNGTITPAGSNLIGNNDTVAAVFPVSAPLVGEPGNPVNPLLTALSNNGGPTQTHKPLAGSPAIDMATGSLPATDQRGIPRVAGVGDIGSVEVVDLTAWNTQDSGTGSLRQTIADASPGTTITFDTGLDGQVIDLAGTQLAIAKDLTLDATSLPNGLTLNGNGLSRVLEISSGVTVSIRGLAITGGASSDGGAIRNWGTLTLSDCTLSQNSSTAQGGALRNIGGSTTIEGCTFTGNTAGLSGGAIFSDTPVDIINSTLTGNSAQFGGGLYIGNSSMATLVHTTIAANSASGLGGGIMVDGGTLNINNSIVANNTGPVTGQGVDIGNFSGGSVVPTGLNLIGNNDTIETVFDGLDPLVGTPVSPLDAMLGTPGSYGGPTQTMPPLAGSPAIDAIAATAGDPDTDQRDYPRPSGSASDLGAVEVLIVGTPGPAPGLGDVSYRPWLEWTGPPGASYEVYLNSGAGFVSLGQTTDTVWVIDTNLALLTFHQWRVDTTFDGFTTTGPVWSFTTQGARVTTSLDENDAGLGLGTGDSLREAIAAAPANSTITFDLTLDGVSTPLSTELVIDRNLTIDASGFANGIALNGNNAHRIFTINTGVTAGLTGLGIYSGSAASGGGINNNGNLTLTNCNFVSNIASGFGGAVYNNGTATIRGSTFLNNYAATAGAVFNSPGKNLTLVNITATGNHATWNGGAIMNYQGNATIVHTTVSGNTASSAGGGIDNDAGAMTIENSIVAANSGAPPGTGVDISNRNAGVILPAGRNLIGDNDTVSSEFDASVDPLVGTTAAPVDPLLASLADNGGPTQTMLPQSGSPALDTGTDSSTWTGNIDQRGLPRPEGPGYDIGAVEVQYPDTDGDGIDDWYETSVLGTNPNLVDSDNDGLVDGAGGIVTTSAYPAGIDLDGDHFVDGELDLGTDPAFSNRGDLAPRNSPDNLIDLGDFLVLVRLVTGAALPSDIEMILGDINGDTQLNAPDILLLQQAILNGTAP
jgi:predicted outer membrane repeat protein